MLHPNLHHQLPPPPLARQWVRWLVPLILVANIGIFVLEMYINDCPSWERKACILYPTLGRYSFQPLRENHLLGPSVATLEKLEGLERKLVVENNDGWRLISCIWLHTGVIHLATNMLSLMVVGTGLEREFGFLNLGALYVVSGFGGSLLSMLNVDHAQKISVGASGALFGLLGAMLSKLCTAVFMLIIAVAINLSIGIFIPHVDNSAHIGGFIAGPARICALHTSSVWISLRPCKAVQWTNSGQGSLLVGFNQVLSASLPLLQALSRLGAYMLGSIGNDRN